MILERCTPLGQWEPIGEYGCADPTPRHRSHEEFESAARQMGLEAGRYRFMSEGREVHRFTVGERN